MFVVETFTLKTEKMADFPCPKMFQDLIKKRPDLMKELKSWGVYQESFGTAGGFIEFSEFDSYEDFQRWAGRIMPDKDFVKLYAIFMDSIIPGSYQIRSVDRLGSWVSK